MTTNIVQINTNKTNNQNHIFQTLNLRKNMQLPSQYASFLNCISNQYEHPYLDP
uniref:Uncharacterized protein n=1 Tax=Arion vulgaris TaxID=1028688 RepID=A0A0B6ZMV8_9EUPU